MFPADENFADREYFAKAIPQQKNRIEKAKNRTPKQPKPKADRFMETSDQKPFLESHPFKSESSDEPPE